jgi:S-(hydroxymethyl)glutathione dehydrogenase / alcohol dehydrogenase
MQMQAAVLWQPGRPVDVREVELAPPQHGEALVRIAACGVCASDLHVVDGDLPEPLPLVLGHEASGVVVETGPGVEGLAAGDHVVVALVPSCGECESCRKGRPNFCELGDRMAATGTLADGTSRLSADGTPLHHFNAVSAFAEYAVVPESCAVPIRRDVPLDVAALVGCAALTGWGAVTRTAGVEPGAAVAVWGCGGVGLITIQAARLAGAGPIVAVDTRPEKLELAERLGATASVLARPTADTSRRVRHATQGGADYAFEAIGRPETIQEAWDALRPGGTAVVVGLPPKGAKVALDTWGFINEKSLRGCFLGSARIQEDVPALVDLFAAGELRLDELVSDRIPLAGLPAAFDRLRAGEAVRQLVVFD